ncbi:MAG: leucine-rich repeat domain-containing protein [Bacteroidaceae bacterium]|nr:leucine-rich repeat domain-containing protein [Bacteroidaceae bacterium]
MKKFLNIFAAIVALGILTGCYEEIDLVDGTAYTTINYTTNDNEIADIITSGYGNMHVISNTYTDGVGKVIVKGKITHLYPYFRYCSNVTSVTIPKGVTTIGEDAFYDCDNLKSIAIPEGVTEIESCAFDDCDRLASVTLPKTLVTIGSHAFYSCDALGSIVIPDKVTTIDGSAFRDCSALKSVTIGSSVTTIGTDAFRGCNNLKTVINKSKLHFTKGSSSFGYVAYYADKITQNEPAKGNYVDLGLSSGVKWATCNLGAATPEELGDRYYWGETTTSMVNNTIYVNVGDDISGNAKYDAARAQWGGNWRMPRYEDFVELAQEGTWYWTTSNGVSGYRVYGPNGYSIFLPYSDYHYWSSTSSEWSQPYDAAMILRLENGLIGYNYHAYRSSQRHIRPVIN